ncbi:hypothetical protein LSAT2_012800 [Lamellibrachia satsuma]|nr:hypothetical protein LSAT2_012800 [Lamellibrachia satsuma]
MSTRNIWDALSDVNSTVDGKRPDTDVTSRSTNATGETGTCVVENVDAEKSHKQWPVSSPFSWRCPFHSGMWKTIGVHAENMAKPSSPS